MNHLFAQSFQIICLLFSSVRSWRRHCESSRKASLLWRRSSGSTLVAEVNACLRALDYASAERFAMQLCEQRPPCGRGWLLRRTLMQERKASIEDVLDVLQDGLAAAEAARASLGCAKLAQAKDALQARGSPSAASGSGGPDACQWVGEWDCEGCYVYQAFSPEIAEYTVPAA